MTPEEIRLIRSSFAKLAPIRMKAGALFYERLFATAPALRPLFQTDIGDQSRKLMDTLALAVGMLNEMPSLRAALRDLGARHRSYGVEPEHYAAVGAALLWTLETGIGPAFDHATRAAWSALYETVALTMEPRLARPASFARAG